jgi:hypothetical protein
MSAKGRNLHQNRKTTKRIRLTLKPEITNFRDSSVGLSKLSRRTHKLWLLPSETKGSLPWDREDCSSWLKVGRHRKGRDSDFTLFDVGGQETTTRTVVQHIKTDAVLVRLNKVVLVMEAVIEVWTNEWMVLDM